MSGRGWRSSPGTSEGAAPPVAAIFTSGSTDSPGRLRGLFSALLTRRKRLCDSFVWGFFSLFYFAVVCFVFA